MSHRVIHIHPDAPRKPAVGAACNGCGVCCLDEPCPVGVIVSRRRRGPCQALEWQPAEKRYRCGVAASPHAHLPWLPSWAAPWARRIVLRWISAATGCDCWLEIQA